MTMRSSVRAVCRFLVAAILLQALCLLLCTPEAVSTYFSAAVLLGHETILCGDDSYTDYYSLRERIDNVSAIVLGIDRTREESYVLIEDFLASLRYGSSVGSILITWIDDETAENWNRYMDSFLDNDDEQGYYESLLLENTDAPEYLFKFHEALAKLDRTLPPQKRFTVVSGTSQGNMTAAEIADRIDFSFKDHEGIILVLTEAEALSDPASLLRTESDRYLCLQCRYSESPDIPFIDFGEPLWLVNTQRMSFFNEWYAFTSHRLSHTERTVSYTKDYSTEPFFLFFYEPEKEDMEE